MLPESVRFFVPLRSTQNDKLETYPLPTVPSQLVTAPGGYRAMGKKLIPLLFTAFVLAGSWNSCKRHVTEPPQDTTHKCDTCCDTCHKPPCDTCNIDKDSAAHAFSWKEFIIPSETNLTGVWIFAANDIYIVGNNLWHFDGTNFTKVEAIDWTYHVPMGALSGCNIFAFNKTDFWMVHVSLAYHTNDGKYFDDLRFGPVNACWGLSSNDMFFVGNSGHIYHYNGVKFDTMTSNTTKDLRSVWGTNDNDVWAGGHSDATGQSVLLHFNGTSWQETDLVPAPLNIYPGAKGHSLEYVWCTDSSGHKIVVPSGSLVWRKTDNGPWRNDTAFLPNATTDGGFIVLSGTRGNSINDFMTVGGWGWVGHWNGKTWKKYDELFDYGNSFYGAQGFSMKDNTACVVGVKSGQSWVAIGTRKQ